jgi:hypothetical protein
MMLNAKAREVNAMIQISQEIDKKIKLWTVISICYLFLPIFITFLMYSQMGTELDLLSNDTALKLFPRLIFEFDSLMQAYNSSAADLYIQDFTLIVSINLSFTIVLFAVFIHVCRKNLSSLSDVIYKKRKFFLLLFILVIVSLSIIIFVPLTYSSETKTQRLVRATYAGVEAEFLLFRFLIFLLLTMLVQSKMRLQR